LRIKVLLPCATGDGKHYLRIKVLLPCATGDGKHYLRIRVLLPKSDSMRSSAT